MARRLGVARSLVDAYYHLLKPRGNILSLTVGGIDARFYVRTPQELRMLESMGGEGSEEHIIEIFLRLLRPGDVVYDIGSNIGLYSVIMAKAVGAQGHVIAFEPESRCFDHLDQNIKLNGLTNVLAFRKALGSRTEESQFDVENYRVMSHDAGAAPPRHLVPVDVVRGDQLVQSEGLPLPKAVKIDVEGMEYAVIEGLSDTLKRPKCEMVCCEIHPHLEPEGINPDMVLSALASLGFTKVDLYPRHATYHAVCYRA